MAKPNQRPGKSHDEVIKTKPNRRRGKPHDEVIKTKPNQRQGKSHHEVMKAKLSLDRKVVKFRARSGGIQHQSLLHEGILTSRPLGG